MSDFTPVPAPLPTDEEITRCLAEDAMGWTFDERDFPPDGVTFFRPASLVDGLRVNTHTGNTYRSVVWSPLTSIADAFAVVEKMRERGFWMKLTSPFDDREDRETFSVYNAGFTPFSITGWNGQADFRSSDPLAARAIGLAAYAAIKGKTK